MRHDDDERGEADEVPQPMAETLTRAELLGVDLSERNRELLARGSLSITQVAELHGSQRTTIWKAVNAGTMRSHKRLMPNGRRAYWIRPVQYLDWLETSGAQPKQKTAC